MVYFGPKIYNKEEKNPAATSLSERQISPQSLQFHSERVHLTLKESVWQFLNYSYNRNGKPAYTRKIDTMTTVANMLSRIE